MLPLTVMMYHYVRDAGDRAEQGSGIPGLSKEAFGAQLDTFARDYEMVSWADVRAALLDGISLPNRACLLTFDDGVCDHFVNVYPELARRNLSGLFFAIARPDDDNIPLPHKLHYLLAHFGLEQFRQELLARLTETQRATFLAAETKYRERWKSNTDALKGPLQRELEPEIEPLLTGMLETHVGPVPQLAQRLFLSTPQILEMRAGGMYIGGHSESHPWFDFIDPARREREIRASCAWLGEFENAPYAFAYPYGGLADDAPGILAQNNFRAAFTTREQTEHTDPFYIGRFDGECL